jgi:predicted nucleic acid-binding Zn ribbon protein
MQSVFDAWPDLVGEQIAAHARPAGLRDGVLTVAVPDPAWATQLRFLEGALCEQLLSITGAVVDHLDIRVRRR